jgi:D-threonine aldolase
MNAAPDRPSARERHHAQALAAVGLPVTQLETPALVIDLDAMERNLQRMARFAQVHGLRLRPHAKTHKSAELARFQIAQGAVGICVQKTDEALALAQAGVADIYISNEVIAEPKLARLAQAVRDLPCRFAIAVDSLLGVERLATALAQAGIETSAAIDVFVEIDVGQGRCGAASPEDALLLAHQVQAHPTLRLAGLQAYHGGAQHLRTVEARDSALAASAEAVRATVAQWQAAGLQVPLITGAGTGSFVREADSGLWGELQAGSYLFMDTDYAANQGDPGAPVFEHALFIKSQVISRGARHAVCDAGHKSHAIDSGLPTVAAPMGLQFANGGDEHGLLRPVATGPLPALGDTVWLVPGHCDPTVNLHDFYIGERGGLEQGVIERIITIDARGALR